MLSKSRKIKRNQNITIILIFCLALQLDLHGMSIEESIQKLENHIARLTGLSSATFIIEV